jgi:hypothetical protein
VPLAFAAKRSEYKRQITHGVSVLQSPLDIIALGFANIFNLENTNLPSAFVSFIVITFRIVNGDCAKPHVDSDVSRSSIREEENCETVRSIMIH